MDDNVFYKIIDDLSAIPVTHKYLLTLARINEPLLDSRIQFFSEHIDKMLPNASQVFWSNGSTLAKGKFEWMGAIRDSTLVVSLNSVEEQNHMDLMGFGLRNVIKNLDYLHKLKENKGFNINVVLNAPYQSEVKSFEFVQYCKSKWPLFNPNLMPFFTWQGDVVAGENEKDASNFFSNLETDIPSLGCGQWFDIHILANGQITKCCIDEAGLRGEANNVVCNNVLDLYANSLRLRESLPARGQLNSCATCTHLG